MASTVIDSSIKEWLYVGPAGGFVLGAAWYTIFKVMSNNAKKYALISVAPIIEQNVVANGRYNLTAGLDVLSDSQFNSRALGLGVRLKF